MPCNKTVKQLNDEARGIALAMKAIHDKADDATIDELASLKSLGADLERVEKELEPFANRADALKTINRIENSLAEYARVDRPHLGHNEAKSAPEGRDEFKTAGREFVESERFKDWLAHNAPHGNLPHNTKASSPTVEVKALYTLAGDSTASRPLLGQADRRTDIVPLGWPMRVVRDLVTNSTTNSDLVEDVRELARENNAAFVAEATATSGSSGEKPESGVTFELIQAAVQTVAHWIPASSRVLADARQLQSIIDAFLREGLEQAVEAAILTGNGTSPNIRGINNTTGILTQAYATSVLATTRKARTKLMVTGREARPNAWVFHPNDWETLDLTLDGENRFYFGGPLNMGTPRLWGVPITESEFQTEGTPLLGNFRQAVIYDREQTGIRVSNQHADFFVRNLIAILAEMRLAFNVRRPSSFISVDVTA